MIRFWPTAGIVCLFVGFFGLIGYGACNAMRGVMIDVNGQWLGKLPLDGGDDCRIRILPTGAFDFECRGRTTYAAKGQWRQYENKLEMDFSLFVRDGKPISERPSWVLTTSAMSNTLCVGLPADRGQPYCWRRAPL